MTLEYNAMQAGLSLAPLSLSMFAVAMLAGRKAGKRRPANIVLVGFALSTIGMAGDHPDRAPRPTPAGALVVPLLITGSGLGLLVSQLNNYTLSPIEEERVSEAAGVNSAAGSFGLSFGLAMAGGIMLAVLSFSFTNMTEAQRRDPTGAAATDREHARGRRRGDEQHASSKRLLVDEPKDVQAEILRINTDARDRSLQVALLVPCSPASSDWSTGSACDASPTSNRQPTSKDSTSPDETQRSSDLYGCRRQFEQGTT